jgi:G3E family GTPase
LVQVEYADVVVLVHGEGGSKEEGQKVASLVRWLNPRATVLHSHTSGCADVDVQRLVDTGRFEMEEAERPGWLRLLQEGGEGTQKAKEGEGSDRGDVEAVVFRARRPFHPARLWAFIHGGMGGVLRSKGFFWLSTRQGLMGLWSQAGSSFAAENGGPWWADTERELWPEGERDLASILADFGDDPEVGDRRQEIVMIGRQEREGQWAAALNECLLREGEKEGEDPFPAWEMDAHDDHDHDHEHDHEDSEEEDSEDGGEEGHSHDHEERSHSHSHSHSH